MKITNLQLYRYLLYLFLYMLIITIYLTKSDDDVQSNKINKKKISFYFLYT